jgi:putative RNA 2'-phosphotransferase
VGEKRRAVRVSKYLSLILRHKPGAAGVSLDSEGWVAIDDLIAGAARHGIFLSRAELDEVVRKNDKQRFAYSDDGRRIRASQGHSIDVDLGLLPLAPPAVLYHGTVERFLPSIMADGIKKRSRQQVHLSADAATAARVGSRRGRPVILTIAAGAMHSAGFRFYLSDNNVWLTDEVPPQFISGADSQDIGNNER